MRHVIIITSKIRSIVNYSGPVHETMVLAVCLETSGPCITIATWRCRENYRQWQTVQLSLKPALSLAEIHATVSYGCGTKRGPRIPMWWKINSSWNISIKYTLHAFKMAIILHITTLQVKCKIEYRKFPDEKQSFQYTLHGTTGDIVSLIWENTKISIRRLRWAVFILE